MMTTCTNCGQPLTVVREDDCLDFWASGDGEVGCLVDPVAKHPCGGRYEVWDYHRPATPAVETNAKANT
jgi:hypothetical protein